MSTTPTKLLLASQSPRRRELLAQIGVDCDTISLDLDESLKVGELPGDYVKRLSREKALAGLGHAKPCQPVLGGDTCVVYNDHILGKPADQQQGMAMLQALSGATHQVYSAVSVALANDCYTELSVTEVTFRQITTAEARAYWHTGEPSDKAGGYGIQGLGAVFVSSINGSYSGVVGLPIELAITLLGRVNIAYWQLPTMTNVLKSEL